MATVQNVVASILPNVAVSGVTVTIQFFVQTDTGLAFGTSVGVPISDTAGQLDNAIFSAVQAAVQQFGDTMPNNASLMVLGGKT